MNASYQRGAEGPLRSRYAEARRARWRSPADVKARYATASVLQGGRVVFNIGGTHAQYDKIDAQTV
jgi:mRNA-degrading endonuclease HigB of HigAB toxin-antitoxin module